MALNGVEAAPERLETRVLPPTQKPEVCAETRIDRQQFKRQFAIVVLLVAAVASFDCATIRDGHVWGDDFALYIQHAKNIVQHVRYDQTNYIFDPQNPGVGPRTYPPGYPLILSLVYWHFGLNFTAMKIENILVFALFLLVLFFILRTELPFLYVVATIAMIGFNPYLWDFKDTVTSDISFLFISYLTLLLIRHLYRSFPQKLHWIETVGVAILLCLSYATRSIGLVFIPVLFLYELVRFRKVSRLALAITIIGLIGWAIQGRVLHGDGDYFRQISLNPRLIASNIVSSMKELEQLYFWPSHLTRLNRDFRLFVFVALTALAAFGYVTRICREVTIYDLFLPLYMATLSLFRCFDLRYVLPAVPLFLLYVFSGLQALPAFRTLEPKKYVFIILLLSTGAIHLNAYSRLTFAVIPEGIGRKESVQLFNYIKANTDPAAVFIFRKPRALGLLGERRASIYHLYRDENDLWSYFKRIGAEYLVEGPMDEPYWHSFIASQRSKLLEVYSNPDFTIYKIDATKSQTKLTGEGEHQQESSSATPASLAHLPPRRPKPPSAVFHLAPESSQQP